MHCTNCDTACDRIFIKSCVCHIRSIIKMDDPSILSTFNKNRHEGKYCDFKIVAGETVFPVHRFVLDARSEFFKTMFSSGMIESNTLVCQSVADAPVVEACLDFIYTGDMNFLGANVVEILKLCHMWQLREGVKKSEEFLSANLNMNDVTAILRLSEVYELQLLRNKCQEFIVTYYSSIENLHALQKEDILGIIHLVNAYPFQFSNIWNVSQLWCSLTGDSRIYCQVICDFPIPKLPFSVFYDLITECDHFHECFKCRKVMVFKVLESSNLERINEENCLKMKELANTYGVNSVQVALDTFIKESFYKVCQRPEFERIMCQKDILFYIQHIHRKCTKIEFSTILRWIWQDEDRKPTFPLIFGENQSLLQESEFQKSLKAIEFASRPSTDDETNTGGFFGLITNVVSTLATALTPSIGKLSLEECFIIKHLSEYDGCHNIGRRVDAQIVKSLKIARESGLLQTLTFNGIKGILTCEKLYGCNNGQQIWDALAAWIDHNFSERQQCIIPLLNYLKLGRFTPEHLRYIISSPLINKVEQRDTHLITLRLFDALLEHTKEVKQKVEKLETKMEQMEKRIKKNEKQLGK